MVLSVHRYRIARGVGCATAAAVFVGCWALLHHWFYAHHQIVDTPVYQGYGNAIDHGFLPYRDFAVEYPPGALPVFAAPIYLFGYADYAVGFGWLMCALGVLCILAVAAAGAPPRALAMIAVSPLLIGSMALSRFDLWPTLLVACAVAALVHERHRVGWGALGAAVAAKLFALVLLPVAVVWTLRRAGRRGLLWSAVVAASVVAVAFLPFAILAPGGLWHSLSGQLSRPLQIESLAASILTTFSNPPVVATHGSLNLGGEGAAAAVTTVLQVVVLVALWIGFALGPATHERLLRYSAACVCAFVVFGKVLSPQFLIWLVPLVPLVRGRRGVVASALLAGAFVATLVYFPGRYWEYIFHLHLAWLVLLRNVVLVALLVALSLPERAPLRSS